MKTLLITHYWHPHLNAGALRWIGFSHYMCFDVLTCRRPIKGMKDLTMPSPDERRVFRFGYKLPAVIWGALTLIPALWMRYDVYIITFPPESLLLTAWILKKMGRRVILDQRDDMGRETQYHRKLLPSYEWLLQRCVSKRGDLILSSKAANLYQAKKYPDMIIYHGYDEIQKSPRAFDPPVFYDCQVNYKTYNLLLSYGLIKTFEHKPSGYGSSSLHTVLHLGYYPNQYFLPDEYGLHSWKEGADKINTLIKYNNDENRLHN